MESDTLLCQFSIFIFLNKCFVSNSSIQSAMLWFCSPSIQQSSWCWRTARRNQKLCYLFFTAFNIHAVVVFELLLTISSFLSFSLLFFVPLESTTHEEWKMNNRFVNTLGVFLSILYAFHCQKKWRRKEKRRNSEKGIHTPRQHIYWWTQEKEIAPLLITS